MKKFFLITASAALISGYAVTASAQDKTSQGNGPRKGGMLGEMDSNSDGIVSKDEFVASAAKRFTAMDSNNDGKVTEEEMKAHHETEKAMHEKRQKEMEAEEDKRFTEMDTDGDGKISKEEMKKHKESKKGKPEGVPGESK